MEFLKTLPKWLVVAISAYVAVLFSYAVYDNRAVELFPPKISAKALPTTAANSMAAQPKPVDLVSVFNMGRSIANAESAAVSSPKSAQDSLNGALQNAEKIHVLRGETKQTMYQVAGTLPQPVQLSRIVDLIAADLAAAAKSPQ